MDSDDRVCAICDNSGDLLFCEGGCNRPFHPTINSPGAEANCRSLGFSRAQMRALNEFVCNNCRYNLHQCFACGQLGSSDIPSGAEVFPCDSGTCCHHYHPECVAKLLHPENLAEEDECKRKVAAGEPFLCPVHKCLVCNEDENEEFHDLQLAVCRRCPKAYHRNCLPGEIAFDDFEGRPIRAWDGLLPNKRILLYCLDHEIDSTLGRPAAHLMLL